MLVRRRKRQLTSQSSKKRKPVRYIDEDNDQVHGLFNIDTGSPEPSTVVPISINNTAISMELNTGATISVM